jgi:hypothetical protein
MRFISIPCAALLVLTTMIAAPLTTAAASSSPDPRVFLKPGETVAPFEAQGIDGVPRRIDFAKGNITVLLIFSSGCPHCHKMIPLWNRWFDKRPSNMAVIGLLTNQEPRGFFQKVAIHFPVLRTPNRQFLSDYKISAVPLTLRILGGGKVDEVGIGELDGLRLRQIFRP